MSLDLHERLPIGVNLLACGAVALMATFPGHPIVVTISGVVAVLTLAALTGAVVIGDTPQAFALPLTVYLMAGVLFENSETSTPLAAVVMFLIVSVTFGVSVVSLILPQRHPAVLLFVGLSCGAAGELAERYAIARTPLGGVFVPFNALMRVNPLHWSILDSRLGGGAIMDLIHNLPKVVIFAGWDTFLTALFVGAAGLLVGLPVQRLTRS